MKSRYLALVITGLAITLSSCKKEIGQHGIAPPLEADVYVAGFVGPQSQAVYWKNGAMVPLTQPGPGAYAYARSIAVNANGVYVAGVAQGMAVYWFNGTTTAL